MVSLPDLVDRDGLPAGATESLAQPQSPEVDLEPDRRHVGQHTSGSYSLTVNGIQRIVSHSAVVTLSVTAAAGTVSGK